MSLYVPPLFERVELIDENGRVWGHSLRRYKPFSMDDHRTMIPISCPDVLGAIQLFKEIENGQLDD